jgi:hypothetical protein
MSVPSTANEFDSDRQRHLRAFADRLPVESERLTWPLERLHRLRDERLRALLRTAKAQSPWHGERLAGVEVDAVTGADLASSSPRVTVQLTASSLVAEQDFLRFLARLPTVTAPDSASLSPSRASGGTLSPAVRVMRTRPFGLAALLKPMPHLWQRKTQSLKSVAALPSSYGRSSHGPSHSGHVAEKPVIAAAAYAARRGGHSTPRLRRVASTRIGAASLNRVAPGSRPAQSSLGSNTGRHHDAGAATLARMAAPQSPSASSLRPSVHELSASRASSR